MNTYQFAIIHSGVTFMIKEVLAIDEESATVKLNDYVKRNPGTITVYNFTAKQKQKWLTSIP